MRMDNQEARNWIFYAAEDLAYGKLGMAELPRASAWSFQQSSEKALKALWLNTHKEIPRTHDVAFLLSGLSETFEIPDHVRDAVLDLAEITPAVRYPGDDQPSIDKADALRFAEAAHVVYDWVVQKYEASIRNC
jgi:HEPN domain-containing protein